VLDAQVFKHRVDDQVASGQVGQFGASDQVLHDDFDLCCGQFAALHRFGKEALGLLACLIERCLPRVINDGAKARARGDDGDARPHGAATGDTDGFDVRHEYLTWLKNCGR